MRSRLLGKLKQNKAFTLMEMMITVAIIVVLLGISVVAINSWTKSIKMTELDSYAKTVYLEAQNQLASLEVEGSLSKLYKDISAEGGKYYDEYHAHKLTVAPTDYDHEKYGSHYEHMYYFTSQDTIITTFIPEMSLSDDMGSYLIELNPESGDVYSVFYWENTNESIPANSQEIYEYIQKMNKKSSDENNRARDSRSEYEIGYYCGALGEGVSNAAYQLNQKVEIVNEEELYVKLSYDFNSRVIEHINGDGKPFDIQVTITGETSGKTWNPEIDIKDNYFLNGGRLETGLLLDGMGAGQDFATITAGTGLIPGENLLVSVKTVYQYDSIKLKEQSTTLSTNSLFEEVAEKTVTKEEEEVFEREISICTVRHLRNLGEQYYRGNIVTMANGKSLDAVRIVQKNDMDFSSGSYVFEGTEYTVKKLSGDTYVSLGRPISAISPIKNSILFETQTVDVVVDGDTFEIKNLVVNATSDDAGLFAKTIGVTFCNVKLEDYTLNAAGRTNVGALVGTMEGGSIQQSGVYLSPSYRDANGAKKYYNQDIDSAYGNVMARRYANMYISGGVNVGGLVGQANGTMLSDCFGAVQVRGDSNVGGLIGASVNQTIKNSYASGDVYCSGNAVGGFVGNASGVNIDGAYATGDVYGANYLGGFVGVSESGYYQNASSYGEVLNVNGTNEFASGTMVGGFISDIGNNDGDVNTLGYLCQVGYNASDSVLKDTGLKKEYSFFAAASSDASAKAVSYPYDGNLLYKAFPFKMVTDSHYGDWPSQYFINTSLVYYEKYEGGAYGYYSVTKLTDTSTENSEVDDYVWVLDSLRDEVCVEDGYALLTMFFLDSVDYTIYQHDDSWQVAKDSNGNEIKGSLQVSSREYGDDKMVLLNQQGALVFNAYEAIQTDKEDIFNANYSEQTVKSSFSTNGMYLYQLPYDLQNTYRYNVDNFYDVIVFDEGYAVGNLKGEEGEVGGRPVIENEVYYYCPHFARLAVNPGLGVSESTTSFEELPAPYTVYVRSARQLNALGRVPYYWNDKGGGTDLITYQQEVDINFSTYTNGTKKYCGEDYNLLAFDTDYENQPIGEWNGDSSGYGAFQNNYNGNFHKIIDYCVKSDKQYVGLFGEIYKAGGATGSQIQNVVMTVTNPNHVANYNTQTDPMEQNNAGYIIGSFVDTSGKSGNNRPRAAVGALVGSDYTIGITDGEASVFTINNCVSTGYKVQYHIVATARGEQQPLGIALGGMLGYTRGNIAHSYAGNDVKLVAKTDIRGNAAAVMVGGFSGSSYYGTTLNCYSGGTIDVDDGNHTYYVHRLRIAGFCPGWMNAPGISNTTSSEKIRYQNVYSFTQISDNVWGVKEDDGTFKHLIPVVSRMRLTYENRMVGFLDWETKWHTDLDNGSETGVRVPGFSFYLTDVFTEENVNQSGATEYFQDSGSKKPKTCDPASYAQLSNMAWVNNNDDTDTHLEVTTTYTYPMHADYAIPYDRSLYGKTYPFPAFVQDADGDYVHYGDWPLAEDSSETDDEQQGSDLGGTLVSEGGFRLGYANNSSSASSNMQSYDVYKTDAGVYYVEFSFSEAELAEGDTLYTSATLPGLIDVGGAYAGMPVYLEFSTTGATYGSCSCTGSSVAQKISGVSLSANTEYVLYIYGVDLSKGENNKNITWEIEEK